MLLASMLGAVAACAFSPLAFGPGVEHSLLGKLTGKWVLQGKIGKTETTHDIVATWVLNEEYVQIHETSREKDSDGKPQYEAIIYVSWDPKKDQFACMWLDTTDVSSFTPAGIGHLGPDGKQIQFLFGDKDDGIETTFAFDEPKNSWSWNIDNLQKGKKSPFAQLVLKRP
jgi:hypothetical protein